MCGRFVVSYTYDELLRLLEEDFDIEDYETENKYPNYNIAPTSDILTIINTKQGFLSGDIKWGIQSFKNILVNVRSETVEKLFHGEIANNKCIIVANGYYEWDESKTPHYFHDNNPLYFAGIYKQVKKEYYVSIITKKANQDITTIHKRMPVILTKKEAKLYLTTKDRQIAKSLLKTSYKVTAHEVHKNVNKVSNNTIKNIQPYQENRLF